ncbi:MAG: S-adenosylmethionine decarboxylase [Candidatus Obscuribacterales bacterium]|nr:S-adenosylmethionine decarboxylase [Candidatus Obscuribacterales bacterium]
MKNLAPAITRQRLLIEATYKKSPISRQDIVDYLKQLPEALSLRIYSEPVVFSPGGDGQEVNQGYDGFVALIDSGISIYVWENAKFLSVVIYTCKNFDTDTAIAFTRKYFSVTELEQLEF